MVVLDAVRLDEHRAHVAPGFLRQCAAVHLVGERVSLLNVSIDVLRIDGDGAVGRGDRLVVVAGIELGFRQCREHCRVVRELLGNLARLRHQRFGLFIGDADLRFHHRRHHRVLAGTKLAHDDRADVQCRAVDDHGVQALALHVVADVVLELVEIAECVLRRFQSRAARRQFLLILEQLPRTFGRHLQIVVEGPAASVERLVTCIRSGGIDVEDEQGADRDIRSKSDFQRPVVRRRAEQHAAVFLEMRTREELRKSFGEP